MNKTDKAKRKFAEPKSAQMLQVMPGKRVRLDPTATADIAVWCLAFKARFQRALDRDHNERTDIDRRTRARHDEYNRCCIAAVDNLVYCLRETISIEDIDAARHYVGQIVDALKNPPSGNIDQN